MRALLLVSTLLFAACGIALGTDGGSNLFTLTFDDAESGTIAVGTVGRLHPHTSATSNNHLVPDRQHPTIHHSVEIVSLSASPADVFALSTRNGTIEARALKPGSVELTVHGKVRGQESKVTITLVAEAPQGLRYRIDQTTVDTGHDLWLARGIHYPASVGVIDGKGKRMTTGNRPAVRAFSNAELSNDPAGDVPVSGPGWVWHADDFSGELYSATAGTFDLPGFAGLAGPHAHFIDPIFTVDWDPKTGHGHVVGKGPGGEAMLPLPEMRDGAKVELIAGTCYLEGTPDHFYAEPTSPPSPVTCRTRITLATTPPGIYPPIEADLPLDPSVKPPGGP